MHIIVCIFFTESKLNLVRLTSALLVSNILETANDLLLLIYGTESRSSTELLVYDPEDSFDDEYRFETHFIENKAIPLISKFIKQWKMSKQWKFCVKWMKEIKEDPHCQYVFEAIFSRPTVSDPTPIETASVFFMYDMIQTQSDQINEPVYAKLSYRFEGMTFEHVAEDKQMQFQENYLLMIMKSKQEIYRLYKEKQQQEVVHSD